MATQKEVWGGSTLVSISADQEVHPNLAAIWDIDATVGSLTVTLPDARQCSAGFPVIQIANVGSNAFAIDDFDGGSVEASLAAGDTAVFTLFDSSTSAGEWRARTATRDNGSAPAVTVFPTTVTGTQFLTKAWRYNYFTDAWSESSGSATATFSEATGAAVNAIAFVCNGTALDHESYTPGSQAFAAVTDHVYRRATVPGVDHETDDKAIYAGATRGSGEEDQVDVYDVSGDAFSDLTDMPDDRHKSVGDRVGSTFYVVMGATSTQTTHPGTDEIIKYSILDDLWTEGLTNSNDPRIDLMGCLDSTDKFWAYCGRTASNGTFLDEVEQYNPVTDSWTAKSVHPNGTVNEGGAVLVDRTQRILTFGGLNADNTAGSYFHRTVVDTYSADGELTDHPGGGTTSGISNCTLQL